MDTILITGANGFIGEKLVMKLLDEGKEVYAIIYPESNLFEEINNVNLHVKCIDLNEDMDYSDEFPINKIDTMYHFAWIGVKPEFRNDLDLQKKNLKIAFNCMNLATKTGIKRIILPGSTNEYLYNDRPLNKDACPSPDNAYGAVKVAIRYLWNIFAIQNNMEFIYAIITGIYSEDRRDNNVIYYTIDKLLKKEKPSLTNLEQLWDYVYIDDVIEALYLIGERGKTNSVYGIGHGDNWKLSNYIEIIHNKIDASLPLGIGDIPYKTDRLPSSCIDLTDLIRDTGFTPKVDFESGISKVIEKIKKDCKNNG